MQTKQGIFEGRSLVVSLHDAVSVVVRTARDLSDRVRMTARFENTEEFETLDVAEGTMVSVRQKSSASTNLGGVFVAGPVGITSLCSDVSVVNGRVFKGPVVMVGGRVLHGEEIGGSGGGSSPQRATLELEIDVPPGFSVRLDLFGAVRARVEDGCGALALGLSGSARVEVGRCSALSVTASCSSWTDVITVDGSVSATVSGDASVTVRDGRVRSLEATASGSGVVRFDGTAETARLTASGAAGIEVGEVTGSCRRSASGAADIRVRKGGADESRPRSRWF